MLEIKKKNHKKIEIVGVKEQDMRIHRHAHNTYVRMNLSIPTSQDPMTHLYVRTYI